jgi:hypothetical protein
VHGQGWYGLHADVDLARTLRDWAKGVHGLITPSGAWRLDFKVGDSF